MIKETNARATVSELCEGTDTTCVSFVHLPEMFALASVIGSSPAWPGVGGAGGGWHGGGCYGYHTLYTPLVFTFPSFLSPGVRRVSLFFCFYPDCKTHGERCVDALRPSSGKNLPPPPPAGKGCVRAGDRYLSPERNQLAVSGLGSPNDWRSARTLRGCLVSVAPSVRIPLCSLCLGGPLPVSFPRTPSLSQIAIWGPGGGGGAEPEACG